MDDSDRRRTALSVAVEHVKSFLDHGASGVLELLDPANDVYACARLRRKLEVYGSLDEVSRTRFVEVMCAMTLPPRFGVDPDALKRYEAEYRASFYSKMVISSQEALGDAYFHGRPWTGPPISGSRLRDTVLETATAELRDWSLLSRRRLSIDLPTVEGGAYLLRHVTDASYVVWIAIDYPNHDIVGGMGSQDLGLYINHEFLLGSRWNPFAYGVDSSDRAVSSTTTLCRVIALLCPRYIRLFEDLSQAVGENP